MSFIIDTQTTDLEYKISQSESMEFTSHYFSGSNIPPDTIAGVFNNTGIKTRQFINPRHWFDSTHEFLEKNDIYVSKALVICDKLIKKHEGLEINQPDNIIFVSSTGLSTPSVDALLINKLRMNNNITRTPIWGLGCAGGAAGLSKAYEYSLAYPERLTLLICLEFCSLAFLNKDHSKSNFIAMALFSDGAASVLMSGNNISGNNRTIKIINTQSTLYYDSTDVMGWELVDSGLKAVFSKDIPNIVRTKVSKDIIQFLHNNNLQLQDIKHFLLHPGGTKIIEEFESSLNLKNNQTKHSKTVLENYGNMSSPTIIYVIDNFIKNGEYRKGDVGIIASLGPGFSSELLLFQIQ